MYKIAITHNDPDAPDDSRVRVQSRSEEGDGRKEFILAKGEAVLVDAFHGQLVKVSVMPPPDEEAKPTSDDPNAANLSPEGIESSETFDGNKLSDGPGGPAEKPRKR